MRSWFLRLNQREQLSLLVLGLAIGLYLLYMLIWSPLDGARDRLAQQNESVATSLQRVDAMVSEITKAQMLRWRLGRLKEADKLRPQQVSLAKRNNVYWAREIARDARDILGANGVTDAYQCGRHMLNAESVYTYEGTHDIHTLIIGQDVTGLAAFDS